MRELTLPKIVHAGMYDASVVHKGIAETKPRVVTGYELEIPLENGGIAYMNNAQYPITANRIICGKPGQVRYTRLPFRSYYVHICVQHGKLSEYLSALPDCFTVTEEEKYCKLFSDIVLAHSFPSDGSELYLAGKVMQLIYMLYSECSALRQTQHSTNPLIAEAISYMDAHYTQSPTLKQIADALNLSPIYFQRLFSKNVGQSPYQYLLSKKLSFAKKLLLTTVLPVAEIAQRAGFASQSHFGAAFKKETGKTPLEFRKEAHRTYPE